MIDDVSGLWLGRVWRPEVAGPSLVTLRDGALVDVTSAAAPTVSALLDRDDPAAWLAAAPGRPIGSLEAIAANPPGDLSRPHFLAPCDLQVIKACGVTFARSMIERVIEERAAGDPAAAEAIRARVAAAIGGSLRDLRAGSPEAAEVKKRLQAEGMWSQYLEVGIGPDAEVFTKAPVLSAVGPGAEVGLHPISRWNNPEPEVVLAVNGAGPDPGRLPGQRRQPARHRGPLGASARQGQGQQRLLRDRPDAAAVRRQLHARRRAPRRTDADRRGGGRLPARRPLVDGRDQPRPRRAGGARPAAATTSTPTGSCCSSARFSPPPRTATPRARVSPTSPATWSPSPRRGSAG